MLWHGVYPAKLAPLTDADEAVQQQWLRKLEHDALAPRAALDALSREASRGAPAARAPALPAEDRARLEAALEAQHAGLAKLLDVARIDARDVGIMAKLREKSAAPRP